MTWQLDSCISWDRIHKIKSSSCMKGKCPEYYNIDSKKKIQLKATFSLPTVFWSWIKEGYFEIDFLELPNQT